MAFRKLTKIPYSDAFDLKEMRTLRDGLEPEDGNKRWQIYFRKNTLCCVRARSGQGVYQVRIKTLRNGSGIVKWAKASKEVMVIGKHYEAALLDFLIARIVLDLDVPFPRHAKIEQSKEGGFQHMIFGTDHPEVEVTTRSIKGQFK